MVIPPLLSKEINHIDLENKARSAVRFANAACVYNFIPLIEPEDVPAPRQEWTLCKRCHEELLDQLRLSPVRTSLRLRIAMGLVAAERSPYAYAPSRKPLTDRSWIIIMAWAFGIAMVSASRLNRHAGYRCGALTSNLTLDLFARIYNSTNKKNNQLRYFFEWKSPPVTKRIKAMMIDQSPGVLGRIKRSTRNYLYLDLNRGVHFYVVELSARIFHTLRDRDEHAQRLHFT